MPDFLTDVFSPANWTTFVFITARVTGMMLAAPLWSMSTIPVMLRGAIIVLVGVVLLPGSPKAVFPAEVLDLPVPLAMELVVGVVIGLTAAVIVQAVTMAGEALSLQMGLSLGPALSPMQDVQASGVGQLKGYLALLIYAGLGGHLMLLQGLHESLRAMPPGSPMSLANGAVAAAGLVRTLYTTAILAAAPVMVALLLTNVVLALLGRAVPQLNAMMVALPLTAGVGLLMLSISLPVISSAIARWFGALPSDVAKVLETLQPATMGP